MIGNAEEFCKLLGIAYRVVCICSGALNNAAAKKVRTAHRRSSIHHSLLLILVQVLMLNIVLFLILILILILVILFLIHEV